MQPIVASLDAMIPIQMKKVCSPLRLRNFYELLLSVVFFLTMKKEAIRLVAPAEKLEWK